MLMGVERLVDLTECRVTGSLSHTPDQIGCPDQAPRYHRFFNPEIAAGSDNIEELGAAYAAAAYEASVNWLSTVPEDAEIGVAFSGGIDSTSVFLLAHHALTQMGRDR